jgi:hypothetical protein
LEGKADEALLRCFESTWGYGYHRCASELQTMG